MGVAVVCMWALPPCTPHQRPKGPWNPVFGLSVLVGRGGGGLMSGRRDVAQSPFKALPLKGSAQDGLCCWHGAVRVESMHQGAVTSVAHHERPARPAPRIGVQRPLGLWRGEVRRGAEPLSEDTP